MTPLVDPDLDAAPHDADDASALQRVEPAYVHVLRLRQALAMIGPLIGAMVVEWFVLTEIGWTGILALPAVLLAILAIVVVPARKYNHLGYALTDRWLRVARGHLFHVDTVVPLVRVQHIDVDRGPLDRLFGTAALVVHTAGTHNSIVTLPGLSPDTASAIRDSIRTRIVTDPE